MEIFALLEACGCLLEGGNAFAAVLDVIFWFWSAPNRTERREAKKEGTRLPPRDRWTVLFWVVTTVVIVLTILTVVKYAVPRQ
jgi:hypothetical protein